jgi:hypothetical protein
MAAMVETDTHADFALSSRSENGIELRGAAAARFFDKDVFP